MVKKNLLNSHKGYLLLAITLFSILFSCTAQQMVMSEPDPKNIHSACIMCHRTNEPAASGHTFADGIDPSTICLDCHHYSENHHPVGFVPSLDYRFSSLNSAFPLIDGEVRCLTCHEAHTEPGLQEPHELLRGTPYKDRREICFQCHYKEKHAEIDPHSMLDKQGAIRNVNGEPVCLMCHDAVPERWNTVQKVTFKADVSFLCWRCHPPMPDAFLGNHLHRKPSRKTLVRMEKTGEEGIMLPLSSNGEITCSSCHNPHQAGIVTFAPAAFGAGEISKLRMKKEVICGGCHDL